MHIVHSGASLRLVEVNSFTLQQNAIWKFKLRSASSVPPKSEDDRTTSWDTPTRGNQEKTYN